MKHLHLNFLNRLYISLITTKKFMEKWFEGAEGGEYKNNEPDQIFSNSYKASRADEKSFCCKL